MKRAFASVLVLAAAVSLTACNKAPEATEPSPAEGVVPMEKSVTEPTLDSPAAGQATTPTEGSDAAASTEPAAGDAMEAAGTAGEGGVNAAVEAVEGSAPAVTEGTSATEGTTVTPGQ